MTQILLLFCISYAPGKQEASIDTSDMWQRHARTHACICVAGIERSFGLVQFDIHRLFRAATTSREQQWNLVAPDWFWFWFGLCQPNQANSILSRLGTEMS
jgi:hypothetical protein